MYTIVSVVEIFAVHIYIKRVKWTIYFEFRCYGDKSNWWRLYEIEQILRMSLFLEYFAISKIYKLIFKKIDHWTMCDTR